MSNSQSITGKIKMIYQPETKGNFTFRKFVLTVDEKYPQHIEFQTVKDNINTLDNFRPGDEVSIVFNIRGREWTSPQGDVKYFNTLEAWKIAGVGQSSQPQSVQSEMPHDDLPF